GEGRMDLFPLHPGNVIYRGERIVDLNYNYGGTATQDNTCQPGASCVPPGTAVRLFTDQTKITYVDRANGFCHQNGATTCSFTWGAPCNVAGTFCAPIQVASNYGFPLPDAVIQISNPAGGSNAATGCEDNTSNQFGLCHFTGPAKVDASTSN